MLTVIIEHSTNGKGVDDDAGKQTSCVDLVKRPWNLVLAKSIMQKSNFLRVQLYT